MAQHAMSTGSGQVECAAERELGAAAPGEDDADGHGEEEAAE